MSKRSLTPRLTDIVQACERIRATLDDTSLESFEADWQKQWLIERGIEIISEASRRLTEEMKARHPIIPWVKVAGIGNVLRHNYEHVAPDILWKLVQSDLPELERVCRSELAPEQTRDDSQRN